MPGSLACSPKFGGYRDYLEEKLVSANAALDRWEDPLWILGRYEANCHPGEAYFVYDDGRDELMLVIDRERMRFRWPA